MIPSDAATAWGHGGIKERFRIVVDELTAWPAGGEAFWVALASACGVPKLASCLQIADFSGGTEFWQPTRPHQLERFACTRGGGTKERGSEPEQPKLLGDPLAQLDFACRRR